MHFAGLKKCIRLVLLFKTQQIWFCVEAHEKLWGSESRSKCIFGRY